MACNDDNGICINGLMANHRLCPTATTHHQQQHPASNSQRNPIRTRQQRRRRPTAAAATTMASVDRSSELLLFTTTSTTTTQSASSTTTKTISTLLALMSCMLLSAHLGALAAPPNDVVTTLRKMKIYPDMLPSLPDQIVTLSVGSKKIKPGDFVAAKDLKDVPGSIVWGQTNSDAQSVIILLDVDRHHATSNNSINSYNLWTQINVQGESLARGWPMMSYEAPIVSCAMGSTRRLVLLVYHQNHGIDLRSVIDFISPATGTQAAKREDFRLNEFVNNHGLTLQAMTAFHVQGPGALCSASHQLVSHSLVTIGLSTLASFVLLRLLTVQR